MPYVDVNILKGLSDEKKKELSRKILKVFDDIGIKTEWVQVEINEVELTGLELKNILKK